MLGGVLVKWIQFRSLRREFGHHQDVISPGSLRLVLTLNFYSISKCPTILGLYLFTSQSYFSLPASTMYILYQTKLSAICSHLAEICLYLAPPLIHNARGNKYINLIEAMVVRGGYLIHFSDIDRSFPPLAQLVRTTRPRGSQMDKDAIAGPLCLVVGCDNSGLINCHTPCPPKAPS